MEVVSLGSMLESLRDNDSLPVNSLVITFDDGYESVYQNAYPVLLEYGFPATIFLVSGYVGKLNKWPGQPQGIPPLRLLNWEQIKEMDKSRIEFGAHSATHTRLDLLSEPQIEAEVLSSKNEIEKHLGHTIGTFAYPYGRYSQQVMNIVSEMFIGACGTSMDFVRPNSQIHAIERIEIYYFQRLSFFKTLFSPAGIVGTFILRKYRSARRNN